MYSKAASVFLFKSNTNFKEPDTVGAFCRLTRTLRHYMPRKMRLFLFMSPSSCHTI